MWKLNKFSIFILWFLCFAFSAPCLFSADMADFLQKGAGSRPLGMGGAFTAISDDSNAVLWNPAGLPQLRMWEFSSIRTIIPEIDTTSDMLSLVYPISLKSAAAISYISSIIDDITVANYDPDTGRFNVVGNFNFKERGLIFSYGKVISKQISAGINIKKYEHQFISNAKRGWGMDLALLGKMTKNFNVGVNIQNLGGAKIDDDRIPTNLKIGTALKLLENKLTIAGDYDTNFGGRGKGASYYGIEYKISDDLILRTGSNKGVFSYGVGVGFANWKLDYSYLKEELSKNYRLSFKYNFGILEKIHKLPPLLKGDEGGFLPELEFKAAPEIEVSAIEEGKIKIVARDSIGNITTRIIKLTE